MTKMFPFIVKDIKNVLIYLPQALCACGIYAVCYGLVTLITGMLAGRLQKNGQQPTGENGNLPDNGQQPTGENGNLPERAALAERLNLWLKNAGHFLGSNLFVIYLWMLVMIVFFCREPGSRIGTNLQFMGTWGTTMQDHAWVIENIFLFLPFGFLFPVLLPKKKTAWTIPVGFLCSVAIEYCQLRTGRGFCQLDDVIMNTLGAGIGFLYI
mgnify:CR=1 FL=1